MKRMLPRSPDELDGMRAARWFRESTASQWDNFGPDAQREQQDRAIERYGLIDAGLEWSVASSGWTSAWRTATWEAMIGSATGGAFDVLVVGYVSRFLRNLKQTLIAVEDHLHAAGVVVHNAATPTLDGAAITHISLTPAHAMPTHWLRVPPRSAPEPPPPDILLLKTTLLV